MMSLYPNAVVMLAVAAYLTATALFIGLHVSNRDYNVVTHAVSDYGVGSSATLFRLYVWSGNVGALALAYLFRLPAQPRFAPATALCLALMVVARIGVAFVPTDLEGSRRTAGGVLHYLFAVLTFALAYVVIDNATPALTARGGPDGLHFLLSAARYTAAGSLGGVVLAMFGPLRRVFGLTERLFISSTLVWFLAASLTFVR